MKIMYFVLAAVIALLGILTVDAQHRDFLTDEEIELVRDAQDIDTRIDVLTKAIDRRFAVLNINVRAQPQKDPGKWGPIPKGTRLELFTDIKKLLQKAIDDIDDVAAYKKDNPLSVDQYGQQRSAKQMKKEKELFPNAMRNLVAAATRYLPALRSSLEKAADEKEKGVILNSIDSCEQIIAATGKI